MNFHDLPTLNAFLNFTSFMFLLFGFKQIRIGNKERHKKFMLAAAVTSMLFLVSYLIYHAQIGSVKFQGTGLSRPIYFAILISHTILAIVVVPMAVVTFYRGLKGKYDLHKKISKKTFYVWSYVSVTGVVVYLMLYQIFG
ncbi:MAG: DUF420 domain-containing protein [Bacteroidota bacterium]|nr:DUF420 domain-containing protein [Bacteroidota bacterium]